MKIRTFNTIEGGVYTVSVNTEDWSEGDKQLMIKYGEPMVDVGGTFSAEYLEFTLPSANVRIMTEVPFKQGFDIRDTADAAARALLWRDTIVARISEAVTTLRLDEDTFTDEDVVTV